MKNHAFILLLFCIITLVFGCFAETNTLQTSENYTFTDDDIAYILEETFSEMECDYLNVTLNREKSIFVVDIAYNGLTDYVLLLRSSGNDEAFEEWIKYKTVLELMHAATVDSLKTITNREEIKLILNIVNDDAYIREDYSTISYNPLLSVGIYGMIFNDATKY